MERIKKTISVLLILCLIISCVAFTEPEKAEAAWDAGDGTVKVYDLDNTFSDGLYRIWEKIVYEKKSYYQNNYYGLTLKNEYVTNSAGKKVATWKSSKILENGGTKKERYSVDFSKLPSDTYTLHFTVHADYNGKETAYTRKIYHSAGKITYSSCKMTINTYGDKVLKISFIFGQLKGNSHKLEIFDSKGRRILSKFASSKIGSNNETFTWSWSLRTEDGDDVPSGTYTFKVSCNGRYCTKKLNITR